MKPSRVKAISDPTSFWRTPKGRLQAFCDALNAARGKERGREMIPLIDEWMKTRSLAEFLRDRADLVLDLKNAVEWDFVPDTKHRYGVYQPIHRAPGDTGDGTYPHRLALWLFGNIVTNPLCEKLAGPCARCQRYYLKKRASQKVYCSRECGNAATALVRTRERIEAERNDKIDRVQAAMKEWKRAETQQDWKHWVSQKTDIDLRFLTRRFDKDGKLKPTQQKGKSQ